MGLSVWAPDIDKVEKRFVSSENMLVYIQTRTSKKKMVHISACIRFWSKWAKIGYKGIAGSVV